MFIITALRSCIYNVAKHHFLPSIRDKRLFNYMNINVEQLNSWIWMLLMLICFCSYFALESRIRLFTASEVDCIFWPVIKCLSITTCTASSWLAEKRRHTHERIFVIFLTPNKYLPNCQCRSAHLCMIHHCLSQSLPQPRAGWQSQASAPVQTLTALTEALTVSTGITAWRYLCKLPSCLLEED